MKILISQADNEREVTWQSDEAPEIGMTFDCWGVDGEWEVKEILEVLSED